MMTTRYPLRNTLVRDAPRVAQVRMSGATAQKIRRAGLSVNSGRESEGGERGVRVAQLVSPTLPPQQQAQSQANSTGSQSPSTPSSDQQTASEGEDFSGDGEGRNTRVWSISRTYPTMARSHFPHPGWGGAWSLRRNG